MPSSNYEGFYVNREDETGAIEQLAGVDVGELAQGQGQEFVVFPLKSGLEGRRQIVEQSRQARG